MSVRDRIDDLWREASVLLLFQTRCLERLRRAFDRLKGLPIAATPEERMVYNELLADADSHLNDAIQRGRRLRTIMGE